MIPAVLDELDGHRPTRRRHRAGRDRHPPRQHRATSCAAMFGDGDRRPRPDRQPRRPRRLDRCSWVGTFGDGVPVWLNREWVEADVRITTGFVEPHFFAGFSRRPEDGRARPGRPGHRADAARRRRASATRDATWGITEGNPVHDDVRAIAAGTGVDFALDVVLNRDQRHRRRPSAASCSPMHAAAIATATAVAMRAGRRAASTSSSRPTPASRSTRTSTRRSRGCRAGCPGGPAGRHDRLRGRVPRRLPGPRLVPGGAGLGAVAGRRCCAEIAAAPQTVPDQWQVQVQAKIQTRARVVMRTCVPRPRPSWPRRTSAHRRRRGRGRGRARRRRPGRPAVRPAGGPADDPVRRGLTYSVTDLHYLLTPCVHTRL